MVANIGTFAQNEMIRRRVIDNQAEHARLQAQISSGRRSETFSGLGDAARVSLSLRQTKSATETFRVANTTTGIRMEQMQAVLNRVQEIANDLRNAAYPAIGSGTLPISQGNAALKARATGALQEMAQLLNTQIDGFYLFSGRRSDIPPVVEPGAADQSGTPLAAISGLAAALPTDNDPASGDALYDAIMTHLDGDVMAGQPGAIPKRYYRGEHDPTNPSPLVARIDTGTDISYGLTARAEPITAINQALFALATTDLTAATEGGFRRIVERALDDLQSGFDGVVAEIGALGVKQTQLRETADRQSDFLTTLDLQIGAIEDVDMAEALSRFNFTQTALEASFRMLVSMRDMSLTRYL
jgi:flagellar hook-associated protein 3 FlgL